MPSASRPWREKIIQRAAKQPVHYEIIEPGRHDGNPERLEAFSLPSIVFWLNHVRILQKAVM